MKALTARSIKKIALLLGLAILLLGGFALTALAAADEPAAAAVPAAAPAEGNAIGMKAIGAGIAIGIAALGGALSMGMVGAKAAEGIARQPEAEGKIRTSFMLTLVFIETAIIYALLAVILIIFVL